MLNRIRTVPASAQPGTIEQDEQLGSGFTMGGGKEKGNEFITELSELETLFTSQIHSREICINKNNNLLLCNMHQKA